MGFESIALVNLRSSLVYAQVPGFAPQYLRLPGLGERRGLAFGRKRLHALAARTQFDHLAVM
jgi:hypothetical protein